jgi:hypothetical protein
MPQKVHGFFIGTRHGSGMGGFIFSKLPKLAIGFRVVGYCSRSDKGSCAPLLCCSTLPLFCSYLRVSAEARCANGKTVAESFICSLLSVFFYPSVVCCGSAFT